ncbi:hypothetical protein BX666DRAFT_2025169 [Dichotomocladium elegans]|nr:hypothetical protein BX666DRAFT_2025169 [Dichotomocladium elegans]
MADLSLPLPSTLHHTLGRERHTLSYAFMLIYIGASLFATLIVTLIITKTEFKFPFPYMCDCLELGLAWVALKPFTPRVSKARSIPLHERNLWLAALAQAAMLIVQPLFLTHAPIGSFQFLSAFALPIAMAASHRLGVAVNISWTGVSVYVLGAWLLDHTQVSWGGSVYGLLYATALALYSIQLKRCLVHLDIWTIIQQCSMRASLCLVLAIFLSGEWRRPIPTFIDEAGFWFQWILSGLLGLGVNVLGTMLIEEASPAIFLIASGIKACVQPLIVAALFGNPLSFKVVSYYALRVYAGFISGKLKRTLVPQSASGVALALAGAGLALFAPSIARQR